MKKITGINIFLILIIITAAADNSSAAVRRMLGPNMTVSWASSYLGIESGSVTLQDNASWTNAIAPGWFFDYLVTPYISLRTNWFFYPTSLNGKFGDFQKSNGKIPLHEAGFSILRHFNAGSINPWFGAGPFMQVATLDDVNSYILHIVLSVGFDYEIGEDTYFCPELMGGIGARLIRSSEEQDVVIDVPTGKDFSSSGIVVFLKLGVGKAF
jgi:hypothetical protein